MKRLVVLLAGGALVACRPELSADESIVVAARVLAVRAEPPESKPGASVAYTALVAGPGGTIEAAPLAWSFCGAPKPLTENNVVSSACLAAASLAAAGAGPSITAATPARACALFGPEAPPGGFRPRDPDVTGGYYQPLRVDLDGAAPAFVLARVTCALANASSDVATEYAAAYVGNANPHLLALEARGEDGGAIALDAVPAGARVALAVGWAPADAESYAYFDVGAQVVTTKREAMRVAWYATGGAFDTGSTGRDEGDLATTTGNAWTAPTTPGRVQAWVVLRDSRGGIDFATYAIDVR